jgi:hypothetical protein
LIAKVEGSGRYIPDWERLYDAAKRVAASQSISVATAKIDLCLAISDRKVKTRVFVEAVEGETGERAAGTVKQRGFQLPTPFRPSDIDWSRSRPKKPVRAHRPTYGEPILWILGWIEVSRDDVSSVLCGVRDDQKTAAPTSSDVAMQLDEGKGPPKLELVRRIIRDLYPYGGAKRGVVPNKTLCSQVNEKLKNAGLSVVSDSTILRAAGRHK